MIPSCGGAFEVYVTSSDSSRCLLMVDAVMSIPGPASPVLVENHQLDDMHPADAMIDESLAANSSPSPHAAPADQYGKAPGSAQLALGKNGDLSRIDILLLKFAVVLLGLAFVRGGLSALSCFESYQYPVYYSLGLFRGKLRMWFLPAEVAICDGVAAGWMSCLECRFMIAPGSEMAVLTEMLRHVAGMDQDACYPTCI
ncbi:hypothetical protein Nepgr_031788 [Nepenthes gracilis]|uniref:Uncharacterized protein n=1 Tax=Nepenthes gracilis TaxID=150966 RepID=A0AAD3THD8_NEPGR|nr:hypothetical protein Nepgr_031788 [Nepenthes gracilis]